MTQPSKENIEVSLRALRQEADQWEQVSTTLAPIGPFITDIQDVNAIQMGIFAPAHDAYHETCTVVARVANGGTAETKRISDLLENIARVYEHEEEVNAATAQSIHQQYGKW